MSFPFQVKSPNLLSPIFISSPLRVESEENVVGHLSEDWGSKCFRKKSPGVTLLAVSSHIVNKSTRKHLDDNLRDYIPSRSSDI